jgi:hypothetical protein
LDDDVYRLDRMASSAFLLTERCMLFTAMAGVPDFSAICRSRFFDDGSRRDIAIEAAQDFAGTLRLDR